MATRTKLRTVSLIDDVRAALSNSNPGRLMSIGTNWSKIRIGVRLTVDGSATIIGTPVFAMGVCSGTANRWNNGGGSTTHFVGASTSNANWNLASNVYFINSGSVDWRPTKRVGTTLTYGLQMPGSLILPTLVLNRRWLLFLDITKGSPNFTLNTFFANAGTAADISKEVFEQTVAVASAALAGHGWGTARTLAVDEATDGYLDAICFGWDRSVQKIELCDVAVVRLA